MMNIQATHLPTGRTVIVQDIIRERYRTDYYVSECAVGDDLTDGTVEGWVSSDLVELHYTR